MPFIRVPDAGKAGVLKDLSVHELPVNCWTDALDVRMLDGYAQQFLGHGQVYGNPAVTPHHVMAVNVVNQRYWLYASLAKIYAVTVTGGVAVHTDITRSVGGDYSALPNQWTSTLLSGIPVFNAGNTIDPPQRWDLNILNKMVTLDNWPANTFCKSMRSYKSFLIALNVTKSGQNYPYMVKWSDAAEPGAVPASWDETDPSTLAGEFDLAESLGRVVDGLQLRDYFMVYKEDSVWRLSFTTGMQVFNSQKVSGMSGAMNRNCIVDLDQFHFVLTNQDIVIHDGQSAISILDKQARRSLFQDMDASAMDRAFVFKNPFLNEVFVCYASIGNSIPNKALVYNYVDKTVTYRSLPSLNHADYGAVDDSLSDTWDANGDPWNSSLKAWNGPGFTPATARVLMASNNTKLYLLDASASFDGAMPQAYLERTGLGYGADEAIKLMKGIRARIRGNNGDTVIIKVAALSDPYETPVYLPENTMTHVIGTDFKVDCLVSGRYFAVRFETGSAFLWILDSYDMEVEEAGWY
jgi:hypothetical protein